MCLQASAPHHFYPKQSPLDLVLPDVSPLFLLCLCSAKPLLPLSLLLLLVNKVKAETMFARSQHYRRGRHLLVAVDAESTKL